MFSPTAKILADSVAENGHRLTTMEVTGHRFILAEFNTHRAFSRNSASSRAIPYAKMREKVFSQLAYPVSWPAEQKGMQGGAELSADKVEIAREVWYYAMEAALNQADSLVRLGVHKSVVNRLLEPFLPHTIIVSATEWQGFWDQRCHPDAQPEIKALAEAMKIAYDDSRPIFTPDREWHLPLIHQVDMEWALDQIWSRYKVVPQDLLKRISVARCARVSYLTHDGVRDHEKDLELYDRLVAGNHWSPFEHVATPASFVEKFSGTKIADDVEGNFTGWHQFRHRVAF